MNKLLFLMFCILNFLLVKEAFGQAGEGREQEESIRIMFWNVENLFDPFDDTLKMDEEFTQGGNHGWTWKRFNKKLNNIYKVIISSGWEPPDIIGLCEVENRWVLERLTGVTPLSKFEYSIVHEDSPDVRGIDVSLLYLPGSFELLERTSITVTGLNPDDDPTRDILFVKGIIKSLDTVIIFVNHWPSRYPGQTETIHKRSAAALKLKHLVDSLFMIDTRNEIIIMGDFNDEPRDESIATTLGAIRSGQPTISGSSYNSGSLYNLIPQTTESIPGTLKFEGRWYLFDQFILSGGLIDKISSYRSEILDHSFLFEPDEAYTGSKPFRTYNGYIYRGGYSDHLPILLDFSFVK